MAGRHPNIISNMLDESGYGDLQSQKNSIFIFLFCADEQSVIK
jgi:hypothetical protein